MDTASADHKEGTTGVSALISLNTSCQRQTQSDRQADMTKHPYKEMLHSRSIALS